MNPKWVSLTAFRHVMTVSFVYIYIKVVPTLSLCKHQGASLYNSLATKIFQHRLGQREKLHVDPREDLVCTDHLYNMTIYFYKLFFL